jgi:hypothetical protein
VPTIYHRARLVRVGTLSLCPPYRLLPRLRSRHEPTGALDPLALAWRSSIPETAVIETMGRGVLDTRMRGYDDLK